MTNRDDNENLGSFYMGHRHPPEKKRLIPGPVLALFAMAAFAAIVWYAYPRGEERYAEVDVPVVRADTEAVKIKPDDPGGMEVRHQDSTVFEPLEQGKRDEVENLLPAPEEPVDKEAVIEKAEQDVEQKLQPSLDLKLEKETSDTEKVVSTTEEKVEALKEKAEKEEAVAETKTEAAVAEVNASKPKIIKMPKDETPVKKPATSTQATASSGNTYIQLGAFSDASKASGEWERLQKKYPSELGGLSLHTEPVKTASGTLTRLQAGKVSAEKAKSICDAIKAKGGNCIVVK